MAKDGEFERLPLRSNPTGQGLLLVGLALLSFGVVMVYSASTSLRVREAWFASAVLRHFMYAGAGGLLMCLLWMVDYHRLARGRRVPVLAGILLLISLCLAVIVLIPGIGAEINGARRWLQIGPRDKGLSFQPSELVKLSLTIFLACWLGRSSVNPRSFWTTFLPVSALIGTCVGLVIIEDFGTAAVIGVTAAAVMLLAGVPWYYLLSVLPAAAMGFYFFVMLVPNRMSRIHAFMNPSNDAVVATYNVQQALIAIGSGGIWGKGLGYGTQKLGYVPEDHTDYIFTVICEELGFVGAALLLGLFLLFLYNSWRASTRAGDKTGSLLSGGLGLLITLQALVHVAVNIGSAPPKGIGLPLVSAGGTSLILIAAAVAVIVSVTAHRYSPFEEGGFPVNLVNWPADRSERKR